jgi:hypothetical protein
LIFIDLRFAQLTGRIRVWIKEYRIIGPGSRPNFSRKAATCFCIASSTSEVIGILLPPSGLIL